jgi:hypothetical protein
MTRPAVIASFAAAVVDHAADLPAGLSVASPNAAASRFAVYRNNVMVSLVAALQSRFPVVCRIVGEDFFRAMARVFAEKHKPASPLLFLYGDDFPQFVSTFPPARGLPYLADVARLEVAVSRAYHAADDPVVAAPALKGITGENVASARLLRHPAASFVRSDHPVGTIWSAHQQDVVPPIRCWSSEAVLVSRPEAEVRLSSLRPAEASFVEALLDGDTLQDAAARAANQQADYDFGAALVGAVASGAFTSLSIEGGPAS